MRDISMPTLRLAGILLVVALLGSALVALAPGAAAQDVSAEGGASVSQENSVDSSDTQSGRSRTRADLKAEIRANVDTHRTDALQKREEQKEHARERADMRKEEAREHAQERKDNMQERFEARKEQAQERLAERREQMLQRVKERLGQLFRRIKERLEAAVTRLEKIADKLERRIADLENRFGDRGFDGSAARAKLEEARNAIQEARSAIGSVTTEVDVEIEAASDTDTDMHEVAATFRAKLHERRGQITKVIESIKHAHAALVGAVREVRAALGRVQAQGSGNVEGSANTDEADEQEE